MSAREQVLVDIAAGTEEGDGPVTDALRALGRASGAAATATLALVGGNGVIYRPGAPTAPPYYGTWSEIQAIILALQGNTVVYIDDSIVSPAPITGFTQGFGRLIIVPNDYEFVGPLSEAEIVDGAALDNVRAFIGPQRILSRRTGPVPPLQHSIVTATFMREGSQLALLAGATMPFVEVAPGDAFAFGLEEGAGLDNSAAPLVPMVDLLPGVLQSTHAWFTLDGPQVGSSGMVRGGANAVFQYTHDLSTGAVDTSGIVGGLVLRQLLDSSATYTFKPGAPYNLQGATEFAFWSDLLNAMSTVSGSTRAIGPKTLWIDDTFAPGGIVDVPAGLYILEGPVTWKGTDPLGSSLRFADGVRLVDSFEFRDLLIQVQNTVDPVIAVINSGAAIDAEVRLSGTTQITRTGTQPFVGVSGAAPAVGRVVLRDHARIVSVGAGDVLSVMGAGNTLDVEASDRSRIETNTLAYAAGTAGAVFLDGAARLDYAQVGAPGFAPDLPGSIPTLETEGTYRRSFTTADIGPGPAFVLVVNHDLSEKYVAVEIWSNVDALTLPDALTFAVVAVDESNLTVAFAGPIPGTWHVVVRR